MKRSPMPDRKKPMKKRSAKTRDVYEREGGRRDFVDRILSERRFCEACRHIDTANGFLTITHRSVDVHEIKTRAMGGDILDDKNVLAVCRRAHEWIHSHPKKARELGLLGSRYAR